MGEVDTMLGGQDAWWGRGARRAWLGARLAVAALVLSATGGAAAAHVGEHRGQGFADHVMTILIDAGGLIVLGLPLLALASGLARRLAASRQGPGQGRARLVLSLALAVGLGGLAVGGIAAAMAVAHGFAPEAIAPERWWTLLAVAAAGLMVGAAGLIVARGVRRPA